MSEDVKIVIPATGKYKIGVGITQQDIYKQAFLERYKFLKEQEFKIKEELVSMEEILRHFDQVKIEVQDE